jgi:hypothetical protein
MVAAAFDLFETMSPDDFKNLEAKKSLKASKDRGIQLTLPED